LAYDEELSCDDSDTIIVLPTAILSGVPDGAAVAVRKVGAAVPVHEETPAGDLLDFTVSNLEKQAVELFIETNSNEAVMAYYNQGKDIWELVSGSSVVKVGEKLYVHAEVDHFSVYCPMLPSPSLVANAVHELDNPASGETELKLPSVPAGFKISIYTSSHPEVIDLDGNITPPGEDTEVELILKVTKGTNTALSRTLKVYVPQRVLDRIVSVPENYESIQAAIDAANNGDTIIVAPGTYRENLNFKGKSITLKSSNPLDSEVVASTIIAGNNFGPVIVVNSGETGAVIQGFTITNGTYGFNAIDGGIRVVGASVTISRNIITDNVGPGIHLENATNCVIEYNAISANSSGISTADSSAEIVGNIVSNNSGAGFNISEGEHVIRGNTITHNIGDIGVAGGINLHYGSHLIENNNISFNESHGVSTYGGSHRFIGNTISYNESVSYGGGFVIYEGQHIIEGNTVLGNVAKGEINASGGGAFYIIDGVKYIIENNVISENTAKLGNGGGIYIHGNSYKGSFTIEGNEITNNTCTGTARWFDESNVVVNGGSGGGLHVREFYSTITGNTITGNNSIHEGFSEGGGLHCWKSDGTISNNIVRDNQTYYGGGIYVQEGAFDILDNSVTNNFSNWFGGGMFLFDGEYHAADNDISENISASEGGGLCLGGWISLMNNRIEVNQALSEKADKDFTNGGGGIYAYGGSAVIASNNIRGNLSRGDGGSGLHLVSGDYAVVSTIIAGNESDKDGGGLYCGYSELFRPPNIRLTGNVFESNYAANRRRSVGACLCFCYR
jgi:parallel beta-helix repeat protein